MKLMIHEQKSLPILVILRGTFISSWCCLALIVFCTFSCFLCRSAFQTHFCYVTASLPCGWLSTLPHSKTSPFSFLVWLVSLICFWGIQLVFFRFFSFKLIISLYMSLRKKFLKFVIVIKSGTVSVLLRLMYQITIRLPEVFEVWHCSQTEMYHNC